MILRHMPYDMFEETAPVNASANASGIVVAFVFAGSEMLFQACDNHRLLHSSLQFDEHFHLDSFSHNPPYISYKYFR